MSDPTEDVRRKLVNDINQAQRDRAALEEIHGQVWDTEELRDWFQVISFLAPFVRAIDRKTGRRGTLMFQHMPRFYWGWEEEK